MHIVINALFITLLRSSRVSALAVDQRSTDLLLAVVRPRFHQWAIFSKIYRPHFWEVVYVCPHDPALWNNSAPIVDCGGDTLRSRVNNDWDLSFRDVSRLTSDLANGRLKEWPALRQDGLNKVKGVLAIHADFWISVAFLKKLNRRAMWLPGTGISGNTNGDYHCRQDLFDQIPKRSACQKAGWNWPEKMCNKAGFNLFCRSTSKALSDISDTMAIYKDMPRLFCKSWADAYYWPRSTWTIFAPLVNQLANRSRPVMNEVALPFLMALAATYHGVERQAINCAGGCCTDFAASQILKHRCGHKMDLSHEESRIALASAWELNNRDVQAVRRMTPPGDSTRFGQQRGITTGGVGRARARRPARRKRLHP
jgi:hypothetical protein